MGHPGQAGTVGTETKAGKSNSTDLDIPSGSVKAKAAGAEAGAGSSVSGSSGDKNGEAAPSSSAAVTPAKQQGANLLFQRRQEKLAREASEQNAEDDGAAGSSGRGSGKPGKSKSVIITGEEVVSEGVSGNGSMAVEYCLDDHMVKRARFLHRAMAKYDCEVVAERAAALGT